MAKNVNQGPVARSLQASNNKGGSEIKKNDSRVLKYALLLGIISFFIYANTLQNGYALDDWDVIQNNTIVKKGISSIPQLLSTPYRYGNHTPLEHRIANDDLYRPLSLVMFATEYSFFGLNPMPGHLINVLLYACCVILLFLFLLHLFGHEHSIIAFTGALLFALHPIHTEVVANIKSRDELLCFFFGLLSLIFFIKYIEANKKKSLLAGLIFYFLSLMAKETSISFIAVIPLVFFFYRNENKQRSKQIFLFSFLPILLYLLARFSILIFYHAYNPSHLLFIDNALAGAPSVAMRIATAILILGKYLKLLIIPYPLICDYAYKSISFVNFNDTGVLLSLCLYILLWGGGAFILFRKNPNIQKFISAERGKQYKPLAFGIYFFLLTLFLFSNLLFLIGSEMAERFLFFPSAGFCISIAFILEQIASRKEAPGNKDIYANRTTLAILLPICLVFIVITVRRNYEWRNNATLFSADSKKSPNDARLYYFVGDDEVGASHKDGVDIATSNQLFRDGIANIQRSLAIYPAYSKAHSSLAAYFLDMQQLDSAELHCKAAILTMPDNDDAYNTLANVYMMRQKYHEAITLLENASAIDPSNLFYSCNIGLCNLRLKKYDSAIFYFRKVIYAKTVENNALDDAALRDMIIAFNALGETDSAKKMEANAGSTSHRL